MKPSLFSFKGYGTVDQALLLLAFVLGGGLASFTTTLAVRLLIA